MAITLTKRVVIRSLNLRNVVSDNSKVSILTNEGTQFKRLLLKHKYVIWHKKDWWYSEPLKEREYSCGLDGKKLLWNGISHHFKHAHNEIYEQFRLMVEQRIFTLQEELVCEVVETHTNQNMSVELKELKPVKSSYTLSQNLIQIDSEGYAHCECGGRFYVKKDGKDTMKQHEKTVIHKAYLKTVILNAVNLT